MASFKPFDLGVRGLVAPPPRTFYRLVTARCGTELKGVFADHKPTVVATHFVEGRTRWCLGDPQDCRFCFHNLPRKTVAYIPAWIAPRGELVIVHFTSFAVTSCPRMLESIENLLGLTFSARRRSASKTSKVLIEILDYPRRNGPVAQVRVLEVLSRLFEKERCV